MTAEHEELRIVVTTPVEDEPMIIALETFDVFQGAQRIGSIAMSSRTTYGVKPRVTVKNAQEEVVFQGLWEEPFDDYDDLPEAAAGHLLRR